MSQLSLVPNPTVIGAQAAIFLANMFVIKKLILAPYLAVREAREKTTGGSHGDAAKLIDEVAKLDQTITAQMRDAQRTVATTREKIKKEANDRRAAIIATAEEAAKQEQHAIEQSIGANLSEERAKKDQIVQLLTAELARLATN